MFGLFSSKGKKAHLGEENNFYYNEELKRWVERGKEHEVAEETIPPPPASSTAHENVTQKRQDTADPGSRYVAAGGFGRSTTEPAQGTNKFSLLAPTAAMVAPQPTEFFMPKGMESAANEAVARNEEVSQDSPSQKYKGFRLPRFQKPDELDGTQEEYEEKELKKWKMKIDRREARKQGVTENGTHRSGSGKLDDGWLMNGHAEATLGTTDMGLGNQSYSTIDEVFGIQQNTEISQNMQPPNESGNSTSIHPVDSGYTMETNHQTMQNGDNISQFSQHNSWMNSITQATTVEPEIDFNSWGNTAEDVTVPNHQIHANEVQTDCSPDTTLAPKVEENPYSEAEYPGSIRESEDPYDTAWLAQSGWNDPVKRKAITNYMCQNYGQEWRLWHREDPVWDQFWCWYYDGGDEIIFSSMAAQAQEENPLNQVHEQNTVNLVHAPYNDSQIHPQNSHELFHEQNQMVLSGQQENASAPVQEANDFFNAVSYQQEPQHLDPVLLAPSNFPIPEPELSVTQQTAELTYVPEDDEDIWGAQEDKIDTQPEQKEKEAPPQEEKQQLIAPNTNHVLIQAESTVSHPIGNPSSSSSKLAPWEDELLFSIPDPWNDASLISDDDSDAGNLPFAIFNHDGMLQFLQKLKSVLSTNNGVERPNVGEFHQQVKKLISAVETSRKTSPQAKTDVGSREVEILKDELRLKSEQVESLQEEIKMAPCTNASLQDEFKKLEETTKHQESLILKLREDFREAQSTIMADKECLQTKSERIDNLEKMLSSKESELEVIRDQLKTYSENHNKDFISSVASPTAAAIEGEVEKLKKENKLLKKKLTSYLKKYENHSSLSNPSSPSATSNDQHPFNDSVAGDHASETETQTSKQMNVLKKKVLQQKKALEEKEALILADQKAMDTAREELEEKKNLMEKMDILLKGKEDEILTITAKMHEQAAEIDLLKNQKRDSDSGVDLAAVEVKEAQISRLQEDLYQKQQDIQTFKSQLTNTSQKDSIISKLTALIGEKDLHIAQSRSCLEESRQRENQLIETLSSKDHDLENLVQSLFSYQKTIFQLQDYCSELGGKPDQISPASVPMME